MVATTGSKISPLPSPSPTTATSEAIRAIDRQRRRRRGIILPAPARCVPVEASTLEEDEAVVTVELGGAGSSWRRDQGAGAVVPGTGHGSDEGIEEKIITRTGALLLPIRAPGERGRYWDRVGLAPARYPMARIRSMLPMASA